MRRLLFPLMAALLSTAVYSCKPKDAKTAEVTALMQVEQRNFNKRQCTDEAQGKCATFEVHYPKFSGGNPAATTAVNNSVEEYILSAVGGSGMVAFQTALDSAALAFIQLFTEDMKNGPEIPMGYSLLIKDTVPFINTKTVTVQLDGSSFMGGAHPSPFSLIVSYDLANGGKPLEITDLVRDTSALKPMLEKAYKLSKGLKETDPLTDIVYPEITQMPMPGCCAVDAKGIRFYYNAYEIAAYAVGYADLLLTWEQLGALADKKRWVD